MSVSSPSTLKSGQLVRVRTRHWLVTDDPSLSPSGTWVRLACVDDDAQGDPLEVIWEAELDREILTDEAWAKIGQKGFDDPRQFAIYTLSKRILRDELSDFGDRSQTSAFFFDVSMLFEYFVRKLLKRSGAEFRDKNSQNWSIPTGVRIRGLIPDLVFEREGKTFVFDVKYKSFDFRDGVSREDLFQLHTYLGQLTNQSPVAGCGFIYPVSESRWQAMNLSAVDGILSDTVEHAGQEIPFHVAFIRVPEDAKVTDGGQASAFRDAFRLSTANFSRAFFRRVDGRAEQSHNGFIGRGLSSN